MSDKKWRDGERYRHGDFYIPRYMMPAIKAYIDDGTIPGDFLQAIICNKFSEVCALADDENLRNLAAYAVFFYNEVPAMACGSKENMIAWHTLRTKTKEETKEETDERRT